MSLPLREVTTPFKGRGPFRNYGPFANKGPFGRNADYSFWNRRMFWNKAAYDAAPGGRKTLMSVAVMTALGFTSSGGANGTVIGSDGNLAAASAPRITYDRGATSNNVPQSQDWATGWTKAGGSDSISGQSLVAGATSGSHALYRSVTMSAAQWTLAAEFVKGSQQATLGVTDGGTDYFAVLDTATGSIVSVQAGATARVEPSVAGWILSVTRTLANATVNAFWGIAKAGSSSFTGAGESVACNGMWTTLGAARGAYLRTTSTAPLYAAGTPVSQNLVPKSQPALGGGDFALSSQVTTGSAIGSLTSSSIQYGDNSQIRYAYTQFNALKNCIYLNCFYIAMDDGGAPVHGNGGTGGDFTVVYGSGLTAAISPSITLVAAGIYRVTVPLVPDVNGASYIGVVKYNTQSARGFRISGYQAIEGTADIGYTATTGTPYSLYPQKSLIHEPARTRETLQPRDLTQAAWTKSGSMTAAKTATGIDGVASSSSTLTSAGTNQTCLQSVTSASAARLMTAWIRSRSASSLTIDMTVDGGTTWNAIVVNAAYQPYKCNQAAVTNPSYGFRLRANGDSIDVDFVQGEQYTTLPAVPPMPIWGTESAAQTLSADNIIAPTSYISNAGPQTTAMRFIPYMVGSMLLARQTNGFPLYMSGGTVAAYDSTNGVSRTITAGIPTIAASRYGSDLAISANGGSLSTASFDGSMGTANAAVGLGSDGAGGNQMWGEFLSLEIATAAATDAQLQAASSGTQA